MSLSGDARDFHFEILNMHHGAAVVLIVYANVFGYRTFIVRRSHPRFTHYSRPTPHIRASTSEAGELHYDQKEFSMNGIDGAAGTVAE